MSELAFAANAATSELSPAELHGTVCGIQCAKLRSKHLGRTNPVEAEVDEDADWADESDARQDDVLPLDDYLSLVGADAVENADALLRFAQIAQEELLSDDLRFMPLLPDDEAPVQLRVEALAEWCAAFLAGFGALGQIATSEEEEEILEDLAAISAADIDGLDAEEAERLYAEIVEYIRVTVLLLLQPGEEDDE